MRISPLFWAMVYINTSFVAQVLLWNQSKTENYAKENIWLTLALYMFKTQRETVINLVPLEREFNFRKNFTITLIMLNQQKY